MKALLAMRSAFRLNECIIKCQQKKFALPTLNYIACFASKSEHNPCIAACIFTGAGLTGKKEIAVREEPGAALEGRRVPWAVPDAGVSAFSEERYRYGTVEKSSITR